MARDAAYIGLGVRRAVEIGMLARVAGQTGLVDLFSRGLGRIEDLGCIAAAIHMSFTHSVAAFAGYASSAVLEGQTTMRIVDEFLANFIVAGCACFRTHKVAWSGFCGASGGCSSLRGGGYCRGAENACAKQQQEKYSQS